MRQNFLYEFWSPDGDYQKLVLTAKEADMYSIETNVMMEMAYDCYERNPSKYNGVLDAFGQCYYTASLITEGVIQEKSKKNWYKMICYTPYGEESSWICAGDKLYYENQMKKTMTDEWWPEHKNEYDEREDFYHACYCKEEPIQAYS